MLPPAPPSAPTTARPAGWFSSLLLAASGLVLFLLLPQRTLHGVDSNQFAVWIEEGHYAYPRHIGYLHLCGLVHKVLAPFGGTGFLALRITAAIGAAVGLFCIHRAFRRLLPEGRGAVAHTVAVLLLPAWFFYATCAEIPGVFAAGVGAAWWAFARWLDGPSVARAAVLGLGCAAAGALHTFGHLLAPALVALVVLWRRMPPVGRIGQLAAMLATHATIALLLPKLLGAGAAGQASDALGHLEERWRTFAPSTTPVVLWNEWLRPYAPWSVLALGAIVAPRARAWSLAVWVLLLLHLPLNVLLLGYEQIDESGAYLIALGPPAVLATLQLLPARSLWPCLAVAIAMLVQLAAPGWRAPISAGFGAGVAELQQQRRIALLVGSPAELDGARAAVPGLMALNLAEVIGAYVQTHAPEQQFAAWYDAWAQNFRALGMVVVWSDSTRRFFADNPDPDLRRFWTEHVPSRYRLTEEHRRDFVGVSIEPK